MKSALPHSYYYCWFLLPLPLALTQVFVLDEADDMIENFAGECMFVKRASCKGRPPPQTLLFSASFECLEPSYPNAMRAKNFTDQIIDRAVREPVVIRVASMEGLRLENVTHFVVRVRTLTGGVVDDDVCCGAGVAVFLFFGRWHAMQP